jgi:hypothetical protein
MAAVFFRHIHGGNGCCGGVNEVADGGVAASGVPEDVGVGGHGCGGGVVGGSQVVPHRSRQLAEKDAKENGAIFVLSRRQLG